MNKKHLLPAVTVSELVVVSNQQERTPITNDAVSETTFSLPFIVTKILIAPGGSFQKVALEVRLL